MRGRYRVHKPLQGIVTGNTFNFPGVYNIVITGGGGGGAGGSPLGASKPYDGQAGFSGILSAWLYTFRNQGLINRRSLSINGSNGNANGVGQAGNPGYSYEVYGDGFSFIAPGGAGGNGPGNRIPLSTTWPYGGTWGMGGFGGFQNSVGTSGTVGESRIIRRG